MTNRSPAARFDALVALAHFRADASTGPALPAVLNCLSDTNIVNGLRIRWAAFKALGHMRDRAPEAVPVLTNLLVDADYDIREDALDALHELGSEAKLALPAVANALTDPNAQVREAATNALRAITPPGSETDLRR